MHIELSEHFTYSKLLRFTFPSIIMMVLTSIYGVVDGFFISNFIGAEPFAAVNIVMPFLMIFPATPHRNTAINNASSTMFNTPDTNVVTSPSCGRSAMTRKL